MNNQQPNPWLDEMRVTFEPDEMEAFFDKFAPLLFALEDSEDEPEDRG